MAASVRAPYQAFWLQDKPVVATQFHPELTGSENRARFARYMDLYGKLFGAEEALTRLNAHQESPEANDLLRRFVDMILPSKRADTP